MRDRLQRSASFCGLFCFSPLGVPLCQPSAGSAHKVRVHGYSITKCCRFAPGPQSQVSMSAQLFFLLHILLSGSQGKKKAYSKGVRLPW